MHIYFLILLTTYESRQGSASKCDGGMLRSAVYVHVLTYARYSLTVHAKDDVRHCRHGRSRTWYERPGAPPPVGKSLQVKPVSMGTGCTARKELPDSSDRQPRHSTRLATGGPPPGGGGVADLVQAR
jgi:hypothetical protein